MSRVHLVILWHMHQPQYRDPATGRYVMPWTRLHALKDYWGMVKLLEEFPGVHATFNVVPALAAQVEEYAGGRFDEPWFETAFRPAEDLDEAGKRELLALGFQLNREHMMGRWPRYVELFHRVDREGEENVLREFGPRDWRDLQLLSQLAWMDEEYLARDPVVSELARQGANFSEDDKQQLRRKQQELLGRVLPVYRAAADRGQVEISTTPYYHPILPLLCDSEVARAANPHTPQLVPAFRHPEDAREQLLRAREYHQQLFGRSPAGLWPSEGSVSDQPLEIAAELGFRWFATDEGVLGRTLNVGFARDAAGLPENAERLYAPLAVRTTGGEIIGLFRDHLISDLVGFVYSRMPAAEAAADLHRRIRAIGERVSTGRPATVSLILDGENAWEYYPGGGREFLRQFYRRVEEDPEIRALTASEAVAAAGEVARVESIHPGSWINANFDVWIGHAEDIRAWELLRDARAFCAEAQERVERGEADAPSVEQMAQARESLLAAEGSDWCWWYGPEHATAQEAEFDALYRKHLAAVYAALGADPPEKLAQAIKRRRERALAVPPTAYIEPRIDGKASSYFEWMGAGLYSPDTQSGAMHGRAYYLRELHYGFAGNDFFVRVDPQEHARQEFEQCECQVVVRGGADLRLNVRLKPACAGRPAGVEDYEVTADRAGVDAAGRIAVAFERVLEIRIARELIAPGSVLPERLELGVALRRNGLPVDALPTDGCVEIRLGEDAFAWAAESSSNG